MSSAKNKRPKKSGKKLPLFEASATLIGTVIGAGILGIPYAVAQVGFPLGLVIMVFLGLALMLRHLMLAEVTLRSKHFHQIPGYAGEYLGLGAKRLSLVLIILGGVGSLLAYIIGQGEVLQAIFGGSSFAWSLIFFFAGALFILAGLNLIKRSELIMSGLILLITVVIGFFAWQTIELGNLTVWQPGNWVLPYGVLIFAFAASVAIPEMREELEGKEKLLKRAILIGSAVVFVVYLLFTFLVLGVTGDSTSEIATVGLGNKIGPEMMLIGNLLAFFTMGTSFLTIGLGLKEMLQFDYQWQPTRAWWFVVVVPLLFFLVGARDFIKILGLVGGILTGVQSIIIILMYWRARKLGKRKPEFSLGPLRFAGVLLIAVFVLGAIFTLINV